MATIQCTRCGADIDENATFCQYCGAATSSSQVPPQQPYTPPQGQPPYQNGAYPPPQGQPSYQNGAYPPPYTQPGVQPPYPPQPVPPGYVPRNRIAAGILAILIGALGIHNFYLGFTGKALAQLLMTVLSCGLLGIVSEIWAIVEGIQILTGSINVDARGVPLAN